MANPVPDDHRLMLASTPPANRWLTVHPYEDTVIRTIRDHGAITLPRLDGPARRRSDLTDEHVGAIRIYDRGLLRLTGATDTHATWTWASMDAHSEALRMLRTRTLGFWPYNLGYLGWRPDTMEGPHLVAMLVWHYRHTGVHRLDIHSTDGHHIEVLAHHADNTTALTRHRVRRGLPGRQTFEDHTRTINPHTDRPGQVFEGPVLDWMFTELIRRVAPEHFGGPRLTVNLNTWHLLPYGTGPRSVTEALPLDTQDALGTLGAPEFATVDDLLAWARTGLTMTVFCRSQVETGRSGSRRHTIRLDPFTGEVATIGGTGPQRQELDAMHMLAALSNQTSAMRCLLIAEAWRRDGVVADTQQVRWTDLQAERVLAIHRVAQTVRDLAR